MQKLRIALLFGGKSAEHEISIRSAKAIYANLDKDKYEVLPLPMTKENQIVMIVPDNTTTPSLEFPTESLAPGFGALENGMIEQKYMLHAASPTILSHANVDIVIPIIHGSFGEDGKLQGMLDLLGIPYLGAGVLGSAIGMDKEIQKILVMSQGIKVVPFKAYSYSDWKKNSALFQKIIEKELSLPLFVKPVNAGSSVGISKVKNYEHLEEAVSNAFLYDTKVIIEEGLTDFREIESAVMGKDDVRVAEAFAEVVPDREFYDYDAKYHPDSTSQVIIPASFTEEEHTKLSDAAKKIFTILQCSGFARIDLFLGKDGTVYFNEINTLPGFTPVSAFSKMWAASGVAYKDLLDQLIAFALEASEEKRHIRYEK